MKKVLSIKDRLITIITGILSIVFVCGKWLEINTLPYQLYRVDKRTYTIFDISDFFDFIRSYGDSGTYGLLSDIFFFGAVAVIIYACAYILMMLAGKPMWTEVRVLSVITSLFLLAVFLGAVFTVNKDMRDLTRGAADNVVQAGTASYMTLAAMAVSAIFSGGSRAVNYTAKPPQIKCAGCGADMPAGVRFCSSCGMQLKKDTDAPMYCTQCGSKIEEGTAFCSSCGKRQNKDEFTAVDG